MIPLNAFMRSEDCRASLRPVDREAVPDAQAVMPGLVPGIHDLQHLQSEESRGYPRQVRA
jgi:hypothetical protein